MGLPLVSWKATKSKKAGRPGIIFCLILFHGKRLLIASFLNQFSILGRTFLEIRRMTIF